ncbi:hypothetical protein ATZ33_11820 [Enterococcus silesiacus]|uniref:DUF5082 domain-containing protein n=1 Tax=Enterococcus silesiacus TaxID=332949 RepID=A0A0S3KCR2_9ENTE|nr:hypothetical protein [Enterococcus silesiacus]ALS02047.1 hypothetical protein ATZ33_11820 [Enterococcus silesiacus]OJG88951.1 hypothetical protein RV15_GL001687 [Enterococcus silesiacus]
MDNYKFDQEVYQTKQRIERLEQDHDELAKIQRKIENGAIIMEEMTPLKREIESLISDGWHGNEANQFIGNMTEDWRHEERNFFKQYEESSDSIKREKANIQEQITETERVLKKLYSKENNDES